MSETFNQIKDLIMKNEVRISEHAYDEMAQEDIFARDVVSGIPKSQSSPAVVITAYRPDPERWTDNFKRRKALVYQQELDKSVKSFWTVTKKIR